MTRLPSPQQYRQLDYAAKRQAVDTLRRILAAYAETERTDQ